MAESAVILVDAVTTEEESAGPLINSKFSIEEIFTCNVAKPFYFVFTFVIKRTQASEWAPPVIIITAKE